MQLLLYRKLLTTVNGKIRCYSRDLISWPTRQLDDPASNQRNWNVIGFRCFDDIEANYEKSAWISVNAEKWHLISSQIFQIWTLSLNIIVFPDYKSRNKIAAAPIFFQVLPGHLCVFLNWHTVFQYCARNLTFTTQIQTVRMLSSESEQFFSYNHELTTWRIDPFHAQQKNWELVVVRGLFLQKK